MKMDPFARKMWRFGLGFAGLMLTMLAALSVAYFHLRPKCPDRVVAESDSPDRKWMASILERRCGDEAPFVSRVNLRPAGALLQRGFFTGQASQGNIFALEQDAAGAGLSVEWTAGDELIVRCLHCSLAFVRQHDAQWGPVHVRYELPQR